MAETGKSMLKETWFVAAYSSELKDQPLAREFFGVPVVLFRQGNKISALEDRCPHKNVPLSMGKVGKDGLRCAYHGWNFNSEGELTNVPSIKNEHVPKCKVPKYSIAEKDGYIWLALTEAPTGEVPSHPLLKGYQSFTLKNTFKSSPDLIMENGVDCTHTAWVHDGLFRSAHDAKEVKAIIRSTENELEIETIEPQKAKSLAMKLLPQGEVRHTDKYLGPHTIRVDYWMRKIIHNITFLMVTPKNDFETHVFTRMDFKMPLGFLIKPILKRLVIKVIAQDKLILEAQEATIRHFQGRNFKSVEADLPANMFLKAYEKASLGEALPLIKEREIAFKM